MKTQSNASFQQATFSSPPPQPAGSRGLATSTSCSPPPSPSPSMGPVLADFGRTALGLLDDLVTLFDPLGLLESPSPVKERPVRVLAPADPRPAGRPVLAGSQPAQGGYAGGEPCEEDFKSRPASSASTPRGPVTGSPGPVMARHTLAVLPPQPAGLSSTIAAASVESLADVLLPVRGANGRLALALMPPTTLCGMQRTPAAWRVSQLRGLLDDGHWEQAARRLPAHSPQRAVALALASCPVRESKGSFDKEAAEAAGLDSKAGPGWRMDSLIVAPTTTVPAGQTPLALQAFPHQQAFAAIGSTFHAASTGDRMDCQDGIYLSPHCTVVTDGLGGHGSESAARRVRVAQVATGQLVTHLVEAIARTEARPAEFLRRHMHALLAMVDHAVASALVAPWPEKDRADNVGQVQARAAFVAVAHLRDGTVAFGVGDCTAHLFTREANGSQRLVTFTPQPDDVFSYDVGGLGDGTLAEGQFRARPFPPGVVQRIIAGSDGVFDAHQGFLELVDGFTALDMASPRAQVGKDLLAGLTPEAAGDTIITALTERTRAYWATQRGRVRPAVDGLDDVALVVRDFKKAS